MRAPIIGILGNLIAVEGGYSPGLERAYVNHDYVESVLSSGGIPFIIPVNNDLEVIEEQIKIVDGLILSGGYDIDPLFYNEEPGAKLGYVYKEVDDFYIKSIKTAVELKKPILGICKGIQALNVAFGGSLYQDNSESVGAFINHEQKSKRYMGTHTTEFMEGSWLYSIFGKEYITNSFHHQSVKKVAEGFRVTAISKDGIIEAIESVKDSFIVGVQWHPEMMALKNPKMLQLFKEFIHICK